MADPNWLYSSIAQSSAAIVAIVGGFITSSVLMRSSEKRSLTNEYGAAQERLELLEKEVEAKRALYETMKFDRFIRAYMDELGDVDKWPSAEEIVKKYAALDLDVQVVKREVAALTRQSLAAKEFMGKHYADIPADYTPFELWVANHRLDTIGYEKEFLNKEYERLREQKRKIEESRRKPGAFMAGFNIHALSVYRPTQPEYEVYQRQREDKEFDAVESQLSQLESQAQLAQREVNRLQSQVDAFSFPENLHWGYVALSYLAVVGIVIPLAMLPSEELSEPNYWVTWLFATGLAVVLVYIGVQIWGLLKK